MTSCKRTGWLPLFVAAAMVAACSKGVAPQEAAEPAATRPAPTLAIPGSGEGPTDPAPPDAGRVRLRWTDPAGWVEQPPTSSMRYAQYRVEGPGGDAECAVYYFGPGQGGDARANAERWAQQFEQPSGGSSLDVMTIVALDGTNLPVQIVEVTGTYNGGMTMTDAPAQKMEGYMLLGGIAEGPDAPWFFKFTGPEPTVRAQRQAFVELLRSLHPSA